MGVCHGGRALLTALSEGASRTEGVWAAFASPSEADAIGSMTGVPAQVIDGAGSGPNPFLLCGSARVRARVAGWCLADAALAVGGAPSAIDAAVYTLAFCLAERTGLADPAEIAGRIRAASSGARALESLVDETGRFGAAWASYTTLGAAGREAAAAALRRDADRIAAFGTGRMPSRGDRAVFAVAPTAAARFCAAAAVRAMSYGSGDGLASGLLAVTFGSGVRRLDGMSIADGRAVRVEPYGTSVAEVREVDRSYAMLCRGE